MADSPIISPIFFQEAMEQLALVEELALEVEERPTDREVLNRLFRVFHTIKGSGAMFGYEEIASFTHKVESLLSLVRDGQVRIVRDLIDLILACKDHIMNLLEGHGRAEAREALRRAGDLLAERLAGVSTAPVGPETEAPAVIPAESPRKHAQHRTSEGDRPTAAANEVVYRIRFEPERSLFSRGISPQGILSELGAHGPCHVTLDTKLVPPLQSLDPESCHLAWDITLRTGVELNTLRDAFIFVEEDSHIVIRHATAAEASVLEGHTRQAEPLVAPAPPVSSPVARAATVQTEAEPDSVAPDDHSVETAPALTQALRSNRSQDYVRVPSQRLDRLVSLVGELVINRSRLTQLSGRLGQPDLSTGVEDLERLVSELRDNVLGIRMMPMENTFVRFRRFVRDLGTELGKDVELLTEGGQTELDKTMLDQLSDTLVHLIRNAIDHGIGTPAERLAQGKLPRGTVRLYAMHQGAHVVIGVEDDGVGLDLVGIRAKAVELGLLAAEEEVDEERLSALVFQPGFSTARVVTNISGRGVGMDVVRQQIQALRGSVSLSSKPGRGTTVRLTLPLTLAIIDGLLVTLGDYRYILPISCIHENVELLDGECATGNGRNLLSLRGELIPFLRLKELFRVPGTRPPIERVVIAGVEGRRLGLVVDGILGTHQTVIQSLGRFYRSIPYFSGATILGDGGVALILDVSGLVRKAGRSEVSKNS